MNLVITWNWKLSNLFLIMWEQFLYTYPLLEALKYQHHRNQRLISEGGNIPFGRRVEK